MCIGIMGLLWDIGRFLRLLKYTICNRFKVLLRVGQGRGKGYPLDILNKWMLKI